MEQPYPIPLVVLEQLVLRLAAIWIVLRLKILRFSIDGRPAAKLFLLRTSSSKGTLDGFGVPKRTSSISGDVACLCTSSSSLLTSNVSLLLTIGSTLRFCRKISEKFFPPFFIPFPILRSINEALEAVDAIDKLSVEIAKNFRT